MIRIKIPLIILLIALTGLLQNTGCVSRKKTILFQNSSQEVTIHVDTPTEYLVQTGDIIYIKVQSIDEKASAFISKENSRQGSGEMSSSEQYLYYNGYEINRYGYIHLPYLDSIKVIGKNTDQIAALLTENLKPFIKDAWISVKLASFRVSVFGEVLAPGTFLFYRKKPTIFDAIALAKPSEYYNAKNVVITRTEADNKIKIVRVDLTTDKILTSPYYYLQPNDQIYIEPLKVKKYGFNTFPYALLLSTISTVMLIYSIFK